MFKKLMSVTRRFLTEEDGPTSVEYAVMMMLIFLACIATIQIIGGSVSDSYQNSSDAIDNAFNN